MANWGKNSQLLNDELSHHGILGMKWGVRRYQNKDGSLTAAGRKHYGYGPNGELVKKGFIDKAFDRKAEKLSKTSPTREHMKASDSDSAVTKRVKNDYNNMSESEFFKKYSVTKDTYAKRVKKYGDPYMNAPAAKLGKKLAANMNEKKRIEAAKREAERDLVDRKILKRGIDSFKEIQGSDLKDKKGRVILTKDDIDSQMAALAQVHLNDKRLSDKAKERVMDTVHTLDNYIVVYNVSTGKYSVRKE